MPKLILTRGLPGSGKTTEAMKWLATEPGRVRVNRDALREALYGRAGVLEHAAEQSITLIQQTAARDALKAGRSVVVDDLNLRAKYARAWADLAVEYGADLEVMDLTGVPIQVCISRDLERAALGQRSVGEQVIRDLHAKFLASGRLAPVTPSPSAKTAAEPYEPPARAVNAAWIVDIDGTLALMGDRRGPFEWSKVGLDELNEPVALMVDQLAAAGDDIIVMSGRDGVCRDETERWLKAKGVPFSRLHMRAEGDCRPDHVVKLELFDEHVRRDYFVRGVLDDRDQVVALWRSLGLMCAQVAPGNF